MCLYFSLSLFHGFWAFISFFCSTSLVIITKYVCISGVEHGFSLFFPFHLDFFSLFIILNEFQKCFVKVKKKPLRFWFLLTLL